MHSIAELVEELLRYNGFSVRREERFLAASKGSIRVLVRIEGEVETLDGTYIEEVRAAAGAEGHDRLLIVHTGNVAPEARALLDRYRVVLWDRDRLSTELGRAVLSAAEGDDRGPELPFMDYLLVGEGGDREAAAGGGSYQGVSATITRERPPVIKGQSDILAYMEDPALSLRPHTLEDRFVERRLDSEEAMAKAPRLRRPARCDLQYVPFHLYDYQVELEDETGDAVVRDNGTMAVNALTGQAQEWNLAPRFAERPPGSEDAAVLRPSIDVMAAYEQANRAVKELHTRIVERVEEHGSVTVFVKRHVKPRDGAIDIEARGLVYVPMWCIEGSEGVAIVNASTGRIVKEEYMD